MEIAAFLVSLVALGISGYATWLNDKRTTEALEEARSAKTQALWSNAIEAVNRVMVDPTTQTLTEPLQTLRITLTALTDGYNDRPGLDKWLATEHMLGSLVGQSVMAGGPPRDGVSLDEHFERIKPFLDWAKAFSQNLRRLRDIGCTSEGIREVHGYAWAALTDRYAKAGKGSPPADFAPPRAKSALRGCPVARPPDK